MVLRTLEISQVFSENKIGHDTKVSAKLSTSLQLWTERSKCENGSFIALCSKYICHLSLCCMCLYFQDWTEFDPWGGPL